MISSLQPNRPRLLQPKPPPINQQPTRSSSASHPPRSQIEALPPSAFPNNPVLAAQQFRQFQLAQQQQQQQIMVLDPARRHPVFFTDRLKKAPNGVASRETGNWGSPVARGYIFEGGDRRAGVGDGDVKL